MHHVHGKKSLPLFLFLYLCLSTPRDICLRSVRECFIWPQADTTALMCLPPSRPDREMNIANGLSSQEVRLKSFTAARERSGVETRDTVSYCPCALSLCF